MLALDDRWERAAVVGVYLAALIERAIRSASNCSATFLDPFDDSGSPLIGVEKAGRQTRLVELDRRYVDVMVRRWQDWAGQAASLEGDGRPFAELLAGRRAAA